MSRSETHEILFIPLNFQATFWLLSYHWYMHEDEHFLIFMPKLLFVIAGRAAKRVDWPPLVCSTLASVVHVRCVKHTWLSRPYFDPYSDYKSVNLKSTLHMAFIWCMHIAHGRPFNAFLGIVIPKMCASRIRTRVCPLRVRRFVHWATAAKPIDFMLCSVFMSSWLRIIDSAFAFITQCCVSYRVGNCYSILPKYQNWFLNTEIPTSQFRYYTEIPKFKQSQFRYYIDKSISLNFLKF